jgi:hypothetical protein
MIKQYYSEAFLCTHLFSRIIHVSAIIIEIKSCVIHVIKGLLKRTKPIQKINCALRPKAICSGPVRSCFCSAKQAGPVAHAALPAAQNGAPCTAQRRSPQLPRAQAATWAWAGKALARLGRKVARALLAVDQ